MTRRRRVQLKRIECEDKLRECYRKRKEGLKKKVYELSTLCGVDAFLVCFGPSGDVVTWPPDDNRALRELVDKYESLAAETKAKHNLNVSSYLLSEIQKQQKRLSKVANGRSRLDDMTEVELREVLQLLDRTLERTRRRIACLSDESLENGSAETAPLAGEDDQNVTACYGENRSNESVESGGHAAETVPWLLVDADDNLVTTTETYLDLAEIPSDVYFPLEEPSAAEAKYFDRNHVIFPSDCDINTSSLASTSNNTSFQEENNENRPNESVESGRAEAVPWLSYPTTLLVDQDDNLLTTTTTTETYLDLAEIPSNLYFPLEEPSAGTTNFDRNHVLFFPSDYDINTSSLASTSNNTSFQVENNVKTFAASTTMATAQIYTSGLYYYG